MDNCDDNLTAIYLDYNKYFKYNTCTKLFVLTVFEPSVVVDQMSMKRFVMLKMFLSAVISGLLLRR